jgi:hypothetical protein
MILTSPRVVRRLLHLLHMKQNTGYVKRKTSLGTEITLYRTQAFNLEADLAVHFIEKMGLVTAIDDGEDSAGRAKLRLLQPAEVVERGCAMAQLAMEQFEKRGWLVEVPSPEPKNDDPK